MPEKIFVVSAIAAVAHCAKKKRKHCVYVIYDMDMAVGMRSIRAVMLSIF